jgi:DNA-directed RNA polymerase specialized sigma24 family protein
MGTAHPDRGSAAVVGRPGDASAAPAPDVWPAELAALYREQRTALVRVAYLLTSDAAAAEEIVDDAALALRTRWGDVDGPQAYLQGTVIERSRSWRRRHPAPRHAGDQVTPVGERDDDPLWAALAGLAEKERTAIVLRCYADFPDGAIAAALRCRPASVRPVIDRGLARLRAEVAP